MKFEAKKRNENGRINFGVCGDTGIIRSGRKTFRIYEIFRLLSTPF